MMKFQDIPTDSVVVRVIPVNVWDSFNIDEKEKKNGIFKLTEEVINVLTKEENLFSIQLYDTNYKNKKKIRWLDIKAVKNSAAIKLHDALAQGDVLCKINNYAKDGSVELELKVFTDKKLTFNEIKIFYDERDKKIVENIKKEGFYEHYNIVNNQPKKENYFFIVAGKNSLQSLYNKEKENKKNKEKEADLSETEYNKEKYNKKNVLYETDLQPDSFCIITKQKDYIIVKKEKYKNKDIYKILKSYSPKTINEITYLVKGNIEFKDYSTNPDSNSEISLEIQAQIDALNRNPNEYMNIWEKYGEKEGEELIQKARKFGYIEIKEIEEGNEDNITIKFEYKEKDEEDYEEKIKNEYELEYIKDKKKLPIYLTNENIKYSKELGEEIKNDNKNDCFAVDRYIANSNKLVLKSNGRQINKGFLFLSLKKSITAITRRDGAYERIINRKSSNPNISLVIYNDGKIPESSIKKQSDKKIYEEINRVLKEKEDNNEKLVLNSSQIDAIKTALNTPDIALIQGPPGTGKTSVIELIVKILWNRMDKDENFSGKILLTSFQHVAVENVASKVKINSLPTPKFGLSKKEKDDNINNYLEKMKSWVGKIKDKLEEKYIKLKEQENIENIKNLFNEYKSTPSFEKIKNIVIEIKNLNLSELITEIKELDKIQENLSGQYEHSTDNKDILYAARNIRTEKESYLDDGYDKIFSLLRKLEQENNKNFNKIIINKLSEIQKNSYKDITKEDLISLKKIKNELIFNFTKPPFFKREKANSKFCNLVDNIINKIENKYDKKDIDNIKTKAIFEFLTDIKENEFNLIDIAKDYNYAYAATCQQSVGKNTGIIFAKLGDTNKQNIGKLEYDYVIIDEAARANPRDLLIVMSQGRKIILVGDHRQLPHMYDNNILESIQIEENINKEQAKYFIERSMFEYLFEDRLEKLKEQDNIGRKVTLDTQYRMHPVIGKFISDNFYGKKIEPGNTEDKFKLNEKLPQKPVLWLDVNNSNCEREEGSLYNKAEIEEIIKKLKEFLGIDNNLTFGIITFYRKQAEKLIDTIKKAEDIGNLIGNKIHIGTVDSFQGKEFDIVFLSVVRTYRKIELKDVKNNAENEKAKKLFGFLCVKNRLNVAMSRGKKLLVVVGNSNLIKKEENFSQKYVKGLYNFYKLCEENGAVETND